jgi:Domain of unknown function (DUF222)
VPRPVVAAGSASQPALPVGPSVVERATPADRCVPALLPSPTPRPAPDDPASRTGGLREALLARLRPTAAESWVGQEAEWEAELAALEAAGACEAPTEAELAGLDPDPLAGPPEGAWAWLADLPGPLLEEYLEATAGPVRPEPLPAGLWSRKGGDGPGFAAGGAGDRLAPGPVLAGLVANARADGLGKLTDDELIGVLRAGRRLASWSASVELAAAGDLVRRRLGQEAAGETGMAEHIDAEIAAALTLTGRAAGGLLDLAMALGRLPLTARALAAGVIDLPRVMVIADEVAGLGSEHIAGVEERVLARAGGQTTTQVRAATHRAVRAADPSATRRRREQAAREARVERWAEHAGTAALAGRDLPPTGALAADQHLTGLAGALRAAGAAGTMDQLRAQVFLALLTGQPVHSLLPPGAASSASRPGGPGSPVSPGEFRPGSPNAPGRPGAPGKPEAVGGRGSPSGRPDTGLAGKPVTSAGRGGPGAAPDAGAAPGTGAPGGRGDAGSPGGVAASGCAAGAAASSTAAAGGAPVGMINLTMPLGTWLGLSRSPGEVPGFGPVDAGDSRALAQAMAAHPRTRWCLTITDQTGRPIAHGCIPRRRGPPGPDPGPPGPDPGAPGPGPGASGRTVAAGPGPGASGRTVAAGPGPGASGRTVAAGPGPGASGRTVATGPGPGASGRTVAAGPGPGASGRTVATGPGPAARIAAWMAGTPLQWLETGQCAHRRESASYRPPPGLQHLIRIRQQLCVFPGCGRPARRCDLDHTLAYHRGGRTCECNLAPLCRKHHHTKQAHGWTLDQPEPGVMTWTTPTGRRYTTRPTDYPG